MISVCFFIVCVNLLCSFDQAVSFLPSKTYQEQNDELRSLLKSLTIENQYEYLANMITPYWNISYDEQLEIKQNRSIAIINMIVNCSQGLKNLMTYKMLPIVPSPVIKAYRNKDVFEITRGVDGNPKTVGCTIGSLKVGKMFCVRPTIIIPIRESHKRVAQVYEDFIRSSPIPACVVPAHGGHWNSLIVRSNEEGDVMVSVTVNPKGYGPDTIEKLKQDLQDYFFKHLPDITLYHQVCPSRHCSNDLAPFNLLYGRRYLTDTLHDYEFKITPFSVFPNNKLGVEVFYDNIIGVANLKHNTTVLDICCGTGTNSIVLSKFVRRTIGFESVIAAVTEATTNAHFNNVRNSKFIFGRVVTKMKKVLDNLHPSSDVMAILNHRRIGLGMDIIKQIRTAPQVSRIFFLFSRPSSRYAVQNFVELCSDNNSTIPPFKLTKVIPFDLLPHTAYVELILLFEREKVEKI